MALTSEWITANAGSGKTTALVGRVVRLLLLGVPAERIVCLTYTKAAAGEMRARVLDRLRGLVTMEEGALAAAIEALVEAPADAAMLARARGLFDAMLDSPSGGVMLTTIHGFCQHLLRRFPIEAGVAPHFTVLEEAEANELLRQAKYALIQGLDSADPLLAEAMGIIGARGGEYRFDTFASDIIAKRRVWEELWRAHTPESMAVALGEGLGGANVIASEAKQSSQEKLSSRPVLAGGETGLLRFARNDVPISLDLAPLRAHLPALLAHGTKTYRELGEGLAQWLEAEGTLEGLVPLLLTRTEKTIRKNLLNAKEYPDGHPLRALLMQLAALTLAHVEALATQALYEESYAVAIFARALLGHYAVAKASRHALDYDDLILYALRLISDPETLGWVMSKLDHRIDQLLIDEAQDNSAAHWQLAEILVEELVANSASRAAEDVPRSLLVVGDEKQSIYSFQGAAPAQFAASRAVFTAHLAESAAPLVSRALTHSYRSSAAVLQLVDRVASMPEIARALTADGVVLPHILTRQEAAGEVVLHPPVIEEESSRIPPLTLPRDYPSITSGVVALSQRIAEEIARMVAGGRDPGEILVLVHRRKPMTPLLIQALARLGVPVAGIDRLVLAEHLAVKDLLALIAWVLDATDDLALAQVLRSPLVGWSEEQLCTTAHGRSGRLWPVVAEPWLAALRTLALATPYDFLTEVLEVAGRRRAFAERFGAEIHEVLDELKQQAAAMPSTRPETLAEFHDWMTGNTRTITREQEGGRGEVRILTVHGAKGLEAPVVILADTVSVPTTQRERLFMLTAGRTTPLPILAMSAEAKFAPALAVAKAARQQALAAEYARLLYVALTRPRDALHVFGLASKKGEVKAGSWYETVAAALRAMGHEAAERLPTASPPTNTRAGRIASEESAGGASIDDVQRLRAACVSPLERSPSPEATHNTVQSTRGVILHHVLELMRATTTEAEIRALLRYFAPDWTEAARAEALAQLAALHRQEGWIWRAGAERELAISGTISSNGVSQTLHARLDALIPDGEGGWIILDYKTATQPPQTEAELPPSYRAQLARYRGLVAALYPGAPLRTAILWTHNATLMWVTDGNR